MTARNVLNVGLSDDNDFQWLPCRTARFFRAAAHAAKKGDEAALAEKEGPAPIISNKISHEPSVLHQAVNRNDLDSTHERKTNRNPLQMSTPKQSDAPLRQRAPCWPGARLVRRRDNPIWR